MCRHLDFGSEVFQDIKTSGCSAHRTATPVVCVIDPAEGRRKRIASTLENDTCAVQAYGTIAEFCAATKFQPDCVLIDFDGLGMTISDVLGMLEKRSGCAIPVAVIGPESVGAAVRCMKAGASDCIAKPLDAAALIECTRRMCAIGRANRVTAAHISAAKAKLDLLTEREKQVLNLMIGGCTNQAVGDELNISGRTAEHYRARIKLKFEAKHLAEVVHTAMIAMQAVPHAGEGEPEPAFASDKACLRRHHRSVGTTARAHFPEHTA